MAHESISVIFYLLSDSSSKLVQGGFGVLKGSAIVSEFYRFVVLVKPTLVASWTYIYGICAFVHGCVGSL